MNSRRSILQFLGLGSLFTISGTATAATINRARAAHGIRPLSPGFVADETHIHTFPVRKFRVVDGGSSRAERRGHPFRGERRSFEQILEDTEKEGWHFKAVAGPYGDQFIFERLEWPTAQT